ncbi:MAG TPA: NUDIX domain-containing protein [Nitrososphaerales archaeon]|nr:NUDIX domain-containing protein [Nitrososphaerales archaeon]
MTLFWHPREGKIYKPFDHTREEGLWTFGKVARVKVRFQPVVDHFYKSTFKVEGDIVEVRAYKASTRRETNFFSAKLPVRNVRFDKSVEHIDTCIGQQPGFRGDELRYFVNVKKLSDEDSLRLREWVATPPVIQEKHNNTRIVRKRGTAIVETPKGVLVLAGKNGKYLLPGGGARKHERRMSAAIRELKEETGLVAKSCKYLFSHDEPANRKIQNLHKVFLIEADGRPHHISSESRHIGYWKPGSTSDLNVSPTTKLLIERFYQTR